MLKKGEASADDKYVVQFDATPWFEQADAQSIILLAGRQWSAPWVGDALERRPDYDQLHDLLQYARENDSRANRWRIPLGQPLSVA
jgi:hypothetical protein